MGRQLQLEVSEQLYQQAQRLATATHRSVEAVLSETLENALSPFYLSDDHEELTRQDEAYIQMHSGLVKSYLGEYVAISGSQVVDHDRNEVALLERVEAIYPDKTVMFRKVERSLPHIINVPSIRLER